MLLPTLQAQHLCDFINDLRIRRGRLQKKGKKLLYQLSVPKATASIRCAAWSRIICKKRTLRTKNHKFQQKIAKQSQDVAYLDGVVSFSDVVFAGIVGTESVHFPHNAGLGETSQFDRFVEILFHQSIDAYRESANRYAIVHTFIY